MEEYSNCPGLLCVQLLAVHAATLGLFFGLGTSHVVGVLNSLVVATLR